MNLYISRLACLLFLLLFKYTFAVETKTTRKIDPVCSRFFAFPGAVAKLEDPSVKYYHLLRSNNRSNGNHIDYFSILHQDDISDSNLMYINPCFSKKAYLSYNQQINIEPISNYKNNFDPIAEVYLEIQNCGYRPTHNSKATLATKTTLEQERASLLTNCPSVIGVNLDFNDIVQAFNKWFVKYECLIRTNTQYFLKMNHRNIENIENTDLLLTIVIRNNNKNLEQEYCIISKNCKIMGANVVSNKKQNIFINNSPENKIIREIIEKFNFECSQFGIGGVTSAIKLFVETFIAPRLLEKKIREKINMNISRGGILHGPPGTGKTLFISAIKNIMEANNLKVKVIKISGPEIFSRYVGDSEKSIRNIFTSAQNIAEDEIAIVLIDEIDAMLTKRGASAGASSGADRVVNQFLTCLDGIDQKNETQCNIIVFGTTNRLDLIDSAVTRPGRMDIKIAFNLPHISQRKEIFEIQTNCLTASGFLNPDVNFQELASKTSGYTGAEIASIVQKAQLAAIREAQGLVPEDNYFYPNKIYNLESLDVNDSCFNFALSKVQPQFGKKSFMDTTDKSFDAYTAKEEIKRLKQTVDHFKKGKSSTLLIHITGEPRSGKSTLAALIVEYFGSSCYYLPAKDCVPYSREGKKSVIIEALNTGDISTETDNFSIILDDFDDIIEYDPALAYNVPLVSIVKSYAKSSILSKKGKLFIIVISSQGEHFLSHIFKDNNCFDINKVDEKKIATDEYIGYYMND